MNADQLRLHARAAFLASSVTSTTFAPKHLLTEPLNKAGAVDEKGRVKLTYTPEYWADLTPDQKEAFLIDAHEYAHFLLFTSTPVGILYYRCQWVWLVGVKWFCEQFEAAGLHSFPRGQSLARWYRKRGHSILRQAVAEGRVTENHRPHTKVPGFADAFNQKMLDVCDELDAMQDFVSILFDPPTEGKVVTVGEFLEVANRAYRYLAERCGFSGPFEWKAASPSDYPLFGEWNWQFNVHELFEAHALLSELEILETVHASEDEINHWKKRRLVSYYKRPFQYFSGFPLPGLGKLLIELAFSGPIDLSGRSDASLYVEHALPNVRLSVMQRGFGDAGATEPQSISELARSLTDNLGLPNLVNTLSMSLNPILLPSSGIDSWPEIERSQHLQTEALFHRGVGNRLNIYAGSVPPDEQADIRPYIEFFADFVSLNNGFRAEDLPLYARRVQQAYLNQALLALARNGGGAHVYTPDIFVTPFLNRIRVQVGEGELADELLSTLRREFLDIERVLVANVGRVGYRSLQVLP